MSGSLTHAVTIHRPRRDVWPWLVQMGAGTRGGWYSYDILDNRGRRSAEGLLSDLQRIDVGTLFPALPGETEGFHVLDFRFERYLILGFTPPERTAPLVTWAFILEETDSQTTRLITRARAGRDYRFQGLLPRLGLPIVRFVHFVMERRQLMEIAKRAEAMPPSMEELEA